MAGYVGGVARWNGEVLGTSEFADWYAGCSDIDKDFIDAAVDKLEELGPTLGRPFADRIKSSRHHHHMKELRPSTSIRIFFAFDPRRNAILLIGGDKRGQWDEFYEITIPIADTLYDRYLAELRAEGIID